MLRLRLPLSAASLLLLLLAGPALAAPTVDADDARRLAKQNNCFRCHAVEKDKNAPSWSRIAAKYVSKPDAEKKLMHHLTSAPKVKLLEEGIEEEHKIATYRDTEQLRNLVDWILSLAR